MMNLTAHQALLRASPYPYLVITPDLTIIAASQAYLRSVSRTESDIVGKYIFDAFPVDPNNPDATDLSEVRGSLLRAIAKGEPDTTAFVRYSVPVPTDTGTEFEERYWSTVHTPVFDDQGEVLLIVQNPVDVTELYRFDEQARVAKLQLSGQAESAPSHFSRAQMHEALSRILNNEREHLRSLFNQAPGFVAVLMGPKHVFEMVNQAYYQLVGHRELIGKTVWDALPEVAGQGFEELLSNVYQTGEQWSARAKPIALQREPNGPIAQRFVDLVYQPYKDRYGTTIGIFAQGYDVTDAVEAQAAKQESEQRLNDGMDAAKMVVWDWTPATGELAHSDNSINVLGFAPQRMEEVSAYVHPDDLATIMAAHERALGGTGAYQEVIRFIRPDNGRQIWVDSRARVQYDHAGKPSKLRGMTMDVTERYEAERELRESNRRKDEFLAMLAHELRNPLAPIRTATDMLKMTADRDPRAKMATDVISRQVTHMTTLVDDLLDVSRVTRGLVQLQKESVDMNAAVLDALEQSRPLIENRQHRLTITASEQPALVLGDHTRLVQVLANLLNNAAKYTPQHGRIAVDVQMAHGTVQVSVTDNGIGIDQKLLPRIFELFTQAAQTPDRTQGGLGIGLALVKSIVELHGGAVSASSAGPGSGTTFTISLAAAGPARPADAAAGPDRGHTNAPAPLRITVVDDNVDAGESLSALLEAHDHSVTLHTDPHQALAAVAERPPQAFILDIGLPGMDGYELARRLRADPRTAAALYIALTGYGQVHDKTLSQCAGIEYHLVKPVDSAKLLDILARHAPRATTEAGLGAL